MTRIAFYPTKAIRIIVTYAPGGSTDVVARMLGQHMGEHLGQQIVVDKAGRLKALAIGGASRSPAAPDIPTVAESGVPGFEYVTWYGLFAPSGTPRAIVTRLNDAVRRSLAKPELEQPLRTQGAEPRSSTPEELSRFMRVEHARWEKVVKTVGLSPQ